jgi:hypothetical protein
MAMNDYVKYLIKMYVQACAAGNKAEAHRYHERIQIIQHQATTPLTPHEMVMAMTPSCHAHYV